MNHLRRDLLRLASTYPKDSSFRRRLVEAVQRESYETGEKDPAGDGWNPGAVEKNPWPKGEGSAMPPERDLKGEQLDRKEYTDNHFAKMAERVARRYRDR